MWFSCSAAAPSSSTELLASSTLRVSASDDSVMPRACLSMALVAAAARLRPATCSSLVAATEAPTCDTCAGVWDKARLLDAGPGSPVVVQELEVGATPALHERYGIDAVPLVLVADADGVVVRHFLGPVTATDLWAAVAEAREPGSTPEDCHHDGGA